MASNGSNSDFSSAMFADVMVARSLQMVAESQKAAPLEGRVKQEESQWVSLKDLEQRCLEAENPAEKKEQLSFAGQMKSELDCQNNVFQPGVGKTAVGQLNSYQNNYALLDGGFSPFVLSNSPEQMVNHVVREYEKKIEAKNLEIARLKGLLTDQEERIDRERMVVQQQAENMAAVLRARLAGYEIDVTLLKQERDRLKKEIVKERLERQRKTFNDIEDYDDYMKQPEEESKKTIEELTKELEELRTAFKEQNEENRRLRKSQRNSAHPDQTARVQPSTSNDASSAQKMITVELDEQEPDAPAPPKRIKIEVEEEEIVAEKTVKEEVAPED